MPINYYAVILCAILSMIIGFVWYGPLFGKKWMEVMKVTSEDIARRKEMQRRAGPLYVVQFFLTLFQVWVLEYVIQGLSVNTLGSIYVSLWAYAAFIVPMLAANAMWNNDSSRISWTRFLLQAGYQLVLFVVFGLVLGLWR